MDCISCRTPLLLLLIFLIIFPHGGIAKRPQAFFVFGDSYADTGNRDPYNQSVNYVWRRPYGFTWPGFPTGRFSSGKIQTDFWAEILGLPCPISYGQLQSHDCSGSTKKIKRGVNFAVGGSGVLSSYGFTTLSEQIKQFKQLIASSGEFDLDVLSRSIVFISVAGSDYAWQMDNRNASSEGLECLVKPVVDGIVEGVKELYECGLRNFALSNVFGFGCAPATGKASCDSNYDDILKRHTTLLTESVHQLRSSLEEASILITDLNSAMNYVFSNPVHYGFVDMFLPCCAQKGGVGMCGEVNEMGMPFFEVCNNVYDKFFWDAGNPTERGWNGIMSLYSYGADAAGENRKLSFVEGAENVMKWVECLGFDAHNICGKV